MYACCQSIRELVPFLNGLKWKGRLSKGRASCRAGHSFPLLSILPLSLVLHPGSRGARYRRPPLPHSRHMGSIRPLQPVWALQRARSRRGRGRAAGETMVVELLLPVWHLTSTLAAAKCLDALQDNKDPSMPLGDRWWTAPRPVPLVLSEVSM